MTGRRWLSALIAKSGFTRSANISMQMYLKEERSLCVPIVLSCRIVFNQFFSCFSDCCCTHWICAASLFLASRIQVRFVLYIYQFRWCHKKQYLVSMLSQQFSQATVFVFEASECWVLLALEIRSRKPMSHDKRLLTKIRISDYSLGAGSRCWHPIETVFLIACDVVPSLNISFLIDNNQ